MTNSTTTCIDGMPKEQLVILSTPTGTHVLPAKPLYNALHARFPHASLEVLQTLLKHNAAYGLYLAKQRQLPH